MAYLTPLSEGDWSPLMASHLAWRMGLGETPDVYEALYQKGLQGSVDFFLSQFEGGSEFGRSVGYEKITYQEKMDQITAIRQKIKTTTDPKEKKVLEGEKEQLQRESNRIRNQSLEEMNLEWISHINSTTRPFSQKLLLFWHNHFSISGEKVEAPWMASYIDLLLSKGLSKWGELLLEIARHPAMLVHLDNQSNVKGHPNENFARELMELFSLGVGNYTEEDVQQSARAFTGWTFDHATGQFTFLKDRHDEGVKKFFEKEGNWNGDQIITMILEHPQSSRFLATKIWSFFAYENPEEELVEEFSQIIRKANFDLKIAFKTLFQSKAFYSAKARGTQVKSPIQLISGTLRLLGLEKLSPRLVERSMQLMGMDLIHPPDVNGWPSGFRWVNTSTLLLRYNFMNFVVNGKPLEDRQRGGGAVGNAYNPMKLVEGRSFSTASDVVDYFLTYFIQRPLQSDLRNQLVKYLETDRSGGSSTFDLKNRFAVDKMRGLIHLILSSPDYQLC
ncbi:MAG: DUF1800 domain-containing protein [Verrucomicrobiota bacterium]